MFIFLLTTCIAKINSLLFFFLSVSANSGIPLWFRCFKGMHDPEAFSVSTIHQGILFCKKLFDNKNCHIIFLADRWFPNSSTLSYINNLNCFYCFRVKSDFLFYYYDSNFNLVSSHFYDIRPHKYEAKYFENSFFTKAMFPTTVVISKSIENSEPWYLVTNDAPSRAVRNYSYRFRLYRNNF